MVKRTTKGQTKTLKYEVWKDGAKRVVVRSSSGKILARRKVKGTGLKKIDFLNIFKENNTLYENRKRTLLGRGRPTNFTENVYTGAKYEYDFTNPNNDAPDPRKTKPVKKPRGKALYVVSGVFRGKRYYGRSTIKGREVAGLTVRTSAEAKEMAWNNLLGVIAMQSEGHNSGDTVFGYEMIEQYGITNIREEWVFYN